MPKRHSVPVALTIAGSDSGGGAGIQADLKTFSALGVHGTSAITCITAQNPCAVIGIEACSPRIVRKQLEAVFAELRPAALKTGMLYSAALIRCVAAFLRQAGPPPIVVDPVMIATSGARLLKPDAVRVLSQELLPLATLMTPNLPETGALLGETVQSFADMRLAARALHLQFGCAVLVKGGHLRGAEALDVLFDGRQETLFRARFIRGVPTHGTGCTLSAGITAGLARGLDLKTAIRRAKQFVTRMISAGHW